MKYFGRIILINLLIFCINSSSYDEPKYLLDEKSSEIPKRVKSTGSIWNYTHTKRSFKIPSSCKLVKSNKCNSVIKNSKLTWLSWFVERLAHLLCCLKHMHVANGNISIPTGINFAYRILIHTYTHTQTHTLSQTQPQTMSRCCT